MEPNANLQVCFVTAASRLDTDSPCSQWSTAFPPPAVTLAASGSLPQQSPPLYPPSSTSQQPTSNLQNNLHQSQQSYPLTSTMPSLPRMSSASQIPEYTPSFVTSSMWRDTVASTYDPGGLKRRWAPNDDSEFLLDSVQVKRPR